MAGKAKSDFKSLKYLQIFMRSEIKARLVAEAKAAGLSQSRYIERLLECAFSTSTTLQK